MWRKRRSAAKVIHEFEEIIRNKKSDIEWLAYYQGKIFQKFRSKERFVDDMVTKFKVSKSTMVFEIASNVPKNKKIFVFTSLF